MKKIVPILILIFTHANLLAATPIVKKLDLDMQFGNETFAYVDGAKGVYRKILTGVGRKQPYETTEEFQRRIETQEKAAYEAVRQYLDNNQKILQIELKARGYYDADSEGVGLSWVGLSINPVAEIVCCIEPTLRLQGSSIKFFAEFAKNSPLRMSGERARKLDIAKSNGKCFFAFHLGYQEYLDRPLPSIRLVEFKWRIGNENVFQHEKQTKCTEVRNVYRTFYGLK